MKIYKFAVETDGRKSIVVLAPDKFMATKKAAAKWGVVWRETARDMEVRQISSRPVKEGK